eukprot:TRINITY_DN6389_c0_g1_i1.p4 TRINITY_DN6389_c0_g1~~TRINITY_DN6389_c0_g1_i1.p4  ORF type:complete len:100 (-),score=28.44 TRINITY_DN6389_c0_g1_i1:150-449(-)
MRSWPKYTQGSVPVLLAELRTILEAGCSVLVAGRAVGDRYLTAADLPPPEGLTAGEWADLFADLTTFQRVDLSSTILRQAARSPDPFARPLCSGRGIFG